MRIPKYITHPTLFCLLAGAVMYLFWLKTPSASDLPQKENLQDGFAKVNKKALLDKNNLYQITDFTEDGQVIFKDLKSSAKFTDKRFYNLSAKQHIGLKNFFVGKFLFIQDPKSKKIELPAKIFEPNCFDNNPTTREQSKQCPLIINP
jgi:hypothetical protein